MRGLNQRFAKPSFREIGTVGSNPTLTTKNFGPLAHVWLEQRTHNSLVRGSTPRGPTRFIVGSIGMRLGLINPGDWSDGLERKGSNPLPTTKFKELK